MVLSLSTFFLLISLVFNPSFLKAQNPEFKPFKSLGKIPPFLQDIEVDQEGNIFLLAPQKHKLYKMFATTGYDSIFGIGGKGMRNEGFNSPSKIEVLNRQSVFVLDFNNRRVVMLNTNLKVTKQINFLTVGESLNNENAVDLFPFSFTIGPSGELFLLNQNDYKIYKLNIYGELETSFGGMDYGQGSLEEPVDLSMNYQNYLFVSDTVHQKISVFDLYGTFQYTLSPESSFRWNGMTTFEDFLICFSHDKLFLKNLITKKFIELAPMETGKLLDVAGTKDYFYLLFENKINLYRL